MMTALSKEHSPPPHQYIVVCSKKSPVVLVNLLAEYVHAAWQAMSSDTTLLFPYMTRALIESFM